MRFIFTIWIVVPIQFNSRCELSADRIDKTFQRPWLPDPRFTIPFWVFDVIAFTKDLATFSTGRKSRILSREPTLKTNFEL